MDNVDESSIHESIYESKFFPWQLPLDCASLSLKIMIRFPCKAVFSGSKVAIMRSFFHLLVSTLPSLAFSPKKRTPDRK